jgi:hypothetical protein
METTHDTIDKGHPAGLDKPTKDSHKEAGSSSNKEKDLDHDHHSKSDSNSSEHKSANDRNKEGVSIDKMHHEGVSYDKMHSDGVSIDKMHHEGVSYDKMHSDGVSIDKMHHEGVSYDKMHSDGVSIDKMHHEGVSYDKMHNEGVSIDKMHHEGVSYDKMHSEGVSIDKMHHEGVSYDKMHSEGVSIDKMHHEGVSYDKMHSEGVSIDKMHHEGVSYDKMHSEGISFESMHSEGVSADKLHTEGVAADKLHGIYSSAELKVGGYKAGELRGIGTHVELRNPNRVFYSPSGKVFGFPKVVEVPNNNAPHPPKEHSKPNGHTSHKSTNEPINGHTSHNPTNEPIKGNTTHNPTNEPIKGNTTHNPINEPIKGNTTHNPINEPIKGTATYSPTNEPMKGTATNSPTNEPMKGTATNSPTNEPMKGTVTHGSFHDHDPIKDNGTSDYHKPIKDEGTEGSKQAPMKDAGTNDYQGPMKTANSLPDFHNNQLAKKGEDGYLTVVNPTNTDMKYDNNSTQKNYFVNGIKNKYEEAISSAQLLSNTIKQPVVQIYSATDGLINDVSLAENYRLNTNAGSPTTDNLANSLTYDLVNNKQVTVYAHSRGAAATYQVVNNLTEAFKAAGQEDKLHNLTVVTVGGFSPPPSDWPKSIHVVEINHSNDPIPKAGLNGVMNGWPNFNTKKVHSFETYISEIKDWLSPSNKEEDSSHKIEINDHSSNTVHSPLTHHGSGNHVIHVNHLTWNQAQEHYQSKTGTPITVELNKIDLSKVTMKDFNEKGVALINLDGKHKTNNNDGLVHGSITLERIGNTNRAQVAYNTEVGGRGGRYNFDMKPWTKENISRNVATIAGRLINGTNPESAGMPQYVGGKGFIIYYEGTVTIKE